MRASLLRPVGSCACQGRLRFRRGRFVQALLPLPPPSAGLGPSPSAPLFFFLAFSGFARSGPGAFVLVFSLSLFFCVVPVKQLHLILIFISPSSFFILIFTSFGEITPCFEQGVCVWNAWTDAKIRASAGLYIVILKSFAEGHRRPGEVGDQRRHLPGTRESVPAGLWWWTWAHLSRSWWPP